MSPITAACRGRSAPGRGTRTAASRPGRWRARCRVWSASSVATRGPASSTGTAGARRPPQSPVAAAGRRRVAVPDRGRATNAITPTGSGPAPPTTRTASPPARAPAGLRVMLPAIGYASPTGGTGRPARWCRWPRQLEVHAGAVGEGHPDGAVVGRHQPRHDGVDRGPRDRRRRRRLEERHQRGVDEVVHRRRPALRSATKAPASQRSAKLAAVGAGGLLLGGGDRDVLVVGAGGRRRDDGGRRGRPASGTDGRRRGLPWCGGGARPALRRNAAGAGG